MKREMENQTVKVTKAQLLRWLNSKPVKAGKREVRCSATAFVQRDTAHKGYKFANNAEHLLAPKVDVASLAADILISIPDTAFFYVTLSGAARHIAIH